ncbi:MAG: 50S ribosomal protein L23, partial [Gammaproteobacteria bacterium]
MSNERLMKVLVAPHISEKSTIVADQNRQFVFQVTKDATKSEVKQAVEYLFKVEVQAVRVCNAKGKLKRFGQMLGRRAGGRKAYVTLKPG